MKLKFKKRDTKIINKYFKLFIILILLFFSKKRNQVKIKNIFESTTNYFNFNISIYEDFIRKEQENMTLIKIKGKKYIDMCLNEKLNKNIFIWNENPIISSIIPVFNSEKTINFAICSIQNQNFQNIEIILIDDFSSDNSYKTIKTLQEYDKRIKIIRNKKNMGSLYSRSIGTLISKGEYIFALDNDDMFFSHDIFEYILNIAKKYDLDIVGFKAFSFRNYEDNIEKIVDLYGNYKRYSYNIIIHQPELSTWMIKKNGHFSIHDVTIWAKCIKNQIYKKAIAKLGMERYSHFVSWAEDTIVNFVIFSLAQSFIFVQKYGIIHLNNVSTASFSISKDIKLFGEIFFVDIIYDFTKNNSAKNYAAYAAYRVKRKFRLNKYVNNKNLIYFKSILNKLLKSLYVSGKNKKKISKYFKVFYN